MARWQTYEEFRAFRKDAENIQILGSGCTVTSESTKVDNLNEKFLGGSDDQENNMVAAVPKTTNAPKDNSIELKRIIRKL